MKYIAFFLVLLTSCVARKEVSTKDFKNDSIQINNNKVKVDTIYKEVIKTVYESVGSEVVIPCDSTKFNQSAHIGKIKYKIIKDKGSVRVVFKRDSSNFKQTNEYRYIYRQSDSLKRLISSHVKVDKKEVVKKPFFANIWMILFWTIFVLWSLHITPIKIIKLFFP